MEERNNHFVNALYILVIGIALGLIAIGISIGISIISNGVVGFAASSWLIPLGTGSIVLLTGSLGIQQTIKVVEKAKKNPYEWLLPILAIFSALVIDTCKELYNTENSIVRVIYGGCVAILFLLGGLVWRLKATKFKYVNPKILALLIFITPPLLIYIMYSKSSNKTLLDAYKDVPLEVWGSLGLFTLLIIIVVLFSLIFKK